jgi:serine/threonine protein phosphatase PrpC
MVNKFSNARYVNPGTMKVQLNDRWLIMASRSFLESISKEKIGNIVYKHEESAESLAMLLLQTAIDKWPTQSKPNFSCAIVMIDNNKSR